MATLVNIRIHTQAKAVHDADYVAINKVTIEGNTIVAEGGNVRYVLGVVPMEDIVVETPSNSTECGCNTTNANIFATLIKGVDGVTPDMSDYYDKEQVDEKLSTKQDAISDLEDIRSGASKGATALQSVPRDYITERELQERHYATTKELESKQDVISDLDAIREGSSKGATAVQPASLANYVSKDDVDAEMSSTSTNPIQSRAVNSVIEDLTFAFGELINTKQPVIEDLDTIRDGAAKGATALQEHQSLKTINGESIIGEGDITIGGGGGGEEVNTRIFRSLVPVGTSIPASANLNTIAYLKVGNYYCSQTANAKTITNCPVEVAFSMEVFNPLSVTLDDETTAQYTYRIRKITAYNTGVQYMQYCNTSGTAGTWTYGSWYVVPRTSFSLASDKNGGSATKGASNRGIYIDSTGTFQQMGYTIGKSVPSNAVFTDTNTKVTSVDNHYVPTEDESAVLDAPEGEVVVGLKRDAAGHVMGVKSATSVNFANDLTGVVEATEETFGFRPTAGDRSIRDESAVIRRIKGNTTVWEQRVHNANFSEGKGWWSYGNGTITIDSTDGSAKLTHNTDTSVSIAQSTIRTIPAGHKTLFIVDYKRGITTSDRTLLYYMRVNDGGYDRAFIDNIASDERRTDAFFLTTTDDTHVFLFYPCLNAPTGTVSTIYKAQLFDLTDLFGAGNEPTTIEAFREVYPDDYYPYCEPELRSMRATSIETVGFNLYNGDYAELIGGKTYYIGGTDMGTLTFTPNGTTASEVIELGDDRTYTPISSGKLSSTYADICVHFQHSGIKDGECADYVEHMLELPEIAKYYPDGMNGIGKVYDEINAENAVKRFGVVDLGTLEWRIVGTANNVDKRIYSYGLRDVAKGAASTGVVGNIMCAKYNAISADQNYLRNRGISIAQTSTGVMLHIYDPIYNSDDKLSDFVASLQGVLLYYELAEPVVTPITEPLQLDYKVTDFGTEKMLSDLPSSPFRADIAYQFNAEGRIRDNSRNIERLESLVDSVKDDISSAIETYIADFTMESLREGMDNGGEVNCDMQALMTALDANKIILVRESEDQAYKGAHVLTGFYEDLLYFSIVKDNGDVLYCEGTGFFFDGDYVNYIDGQTLFYRSWDDKQDTLVSGENIKTVNGESILGSGDITISGGGGASGSAQLPANYISSNVTQLYAIPSGKVTIFSTPQTEGVKMQLSTVDMERDKDNAWVIRLSIGADNTGAYIVLTDDNSSIKWANGIAPTFENGKTYELSFRKIGSCFLGVWASFE